jgi:hypothetical protein
MNAAAHALAYTPPASGEMMVTDGPDRTAMLTMAEEQEAILAVLEARRDELRRDHQCSRQAARGIRRSLGRDHVGHHYGDGPDDWMYALEVADPVQDDYYSIDGVAVSNFTFPITGTVRVVLPPLGGAKPVKRIALPTKR